MGQLIFPPGHEHGYRSDLAKSSEKKQFPEQSGLLENTQACLTADAVLCTQLPFHSPEMYCIKIY